MGSLYTELIGVHVRIQRRTGGPDPHELLKITKI